MAETSAQLPSAVFFEVAVSKKSQIAEPSLSRSNISNPSNAITPTRKRMATEIHTFDPYGDLVFILSRPPPSDMGDSVESTELTTAITPPSETDNEAEAVENTGEDATDKAESSLDDLNEDGQLNETPDGDIKGENENEEDEEEEEAESDIC